jgi:hypothetical protein
MMLTASLPMYNLPEMRTCNSDFWEALHGLLTKRGLAGLPENLIFDRLPVPERLRRPKPSRAVYRAGRLSGTGRSRH